jgi:imidazolonepropionase-like amidohydrolase
MKWVIKTRKLYDGTRNPAVDNGVVVMENDKIIAAGPSSQVNVPANARWWLVKDGMLVV